MYAVTERGIIEAMASGDNTDRHSAAEKQLIIIPGATHYLKNRDPWRRWPSWRGSGLLAISGTRMRFAEKPGEKGPQASTVAIIGTSSL
jgi:hypothetical protein